MVYSTNNLNSSSILACFLDHGQQVFLKAKLKLPTQFYMVCLSIHYIIVSLCPDTEDLKTRLNVVKKEYDMWIDKVKIR